MRNGDEPDQECNAGVSGIQRSFAGSPQRLSVGAWRAHVRRVPPDLRIRMRVEVGTVVRSGREQVPAARRSRSARGALSEPRRAALALAAARVLAHK